MENKKQTIWRVHVEKLAEDVWEALRRDPSLNAHCSTFTAAVVDVAKETFNVVEEPERLISDELREKILNDQVFLKEFAVNNFMYDGLEYDHAQGLLGDLIDADLIDEYSCHGCDQAVIAELKATGKFGGAVYDDLHGGEEEDN
jgi:hypothetical protein